MGEVISNQLKAVLCTDDVTSSVAPFSRDDCYTIQHFEYKCERSRDEHGTPFGSTLSVVLKTSVKVTSADAGKILLERLGQDSRYPFTILFSASFDSSRRLKDYDAGMVVYGYVVDVTETHVASSQGQAQQMQIAFDILVSSITYLGTESNKSLCLIRNND